MYMLRSKQSSAVPSESQAHIKTLSFPHDHRVTEQKGKVWRIYERGSDNTGSHNQNVGPDF